MQNQDDIQQIHTKIQTIPRKGIKSVKTEQILMATAQNMIKLHNME